jgi:hypothetical protein
MAWIQQECIAYLEKIRWDGVPHCPYCGSRRSSPLEQGVENSRSNSNEMSGLGHR